MKNSDLNTRQGFLCAICSANVVEEEIRFEEYSVRTCRNCKYGEVFPMPSPEKLTQLYNSKEYFASHMRYDFDKITKDEIRQNIEKNKRLHGTYLKSYLSGGRKKILEIGSGGGFALKAFEEMGHTVKGIETSQSAGEFSINRFKLDILNTSIENAELDDQYDIVMLNHVLEHFLNVKEATNKISSFVKQKGILYIRVPDHNSYDRRMYQKSWPAYAYYHISNFSKESLEILFKDSGFKVLEVKRFISNKAPKLVKLLAKGPLRQKFSEWYSGRSITIIAEKI